MRRLLPLLLLIVLPVAHAQTWEPIHTGFGIVGTAGTNYAVNLTASDGAFLYAIVAHTSESRVRFFRSPDQGTTWQELPAYVTAGGALTSAFAVRGGRLLAVRHSNGALLSSDDRGTTWTSAATGATGAAAIARAGQKIVIAQGTTPYRISTDAGATWASGPSGAGGLLNLVADNDRAFVGIDFASRLVRSTDGTTWTLVNIPGVFAFSHVWSVGATFYAKSIGNTGDAGLTFTSTDDGATWTSASTFSRTGFSYAYPVPGGSAWLLNDTPANGSALFRTTDRGATATSITLNYPRVGGGTSALCTSNFTTTTDYAIANAWACGSNAGGVGLYRFRLTAGVANESAPGTPALAITLTPNPVASHLVVRAANLTAGAVRLAVYDTRGRMVAVLHDGPVMGTLDASANVAAWAPGLYLVRLTTGGAVVTRPVVVQ